MALVLKSVLDPEFRAFGQVCQQFETGELLQKLREVSPKPEAGTVYVPGDAQLEALPAARELSERYYGGMPIQVGYCNGSNTTLNCLEYHRDSEVDIPADDVVLLLARQQDITGGKLDTSKVEAFVCPAGVAVELYATTLHYAPCESVKGRGFRVIIVLPRGTNTEKPQIETKSWEDGLLFARNKWLLAHPDSPEAKGGAYVGLSGQNIDITGNIK